MRTAGFVANIEAWQTIDAQIRLKEVSCAISWGESHENREFAVPDDRHHRAVARVALRQLVRAQEVGQDSQLALRIKTWREPF
jgi:hypothetical protein